MVERWLATLGLAALGSLGTIGNRASVPVASGVATEQRLAERVSEVDPTYVERVNEKGQLAEIVGPSGSVALNVTVTNSIGCTADGSVSVPTSVCDPVPGLYTVAPCRLIDTRGASGPLGGPSLPSGGARTFPVTGSCGVPATATAVSVNLVSVNPDNGPGFLTLFPGGTALPFASTLNYKAGQTRAVNAIVPLGVAGDFAIYCRQGTGKTDLVVDVNGYFQ